MSESESKEEGCVNDSLDHIETDYTPAERRANRREVLDFFRETVEMLRLEGVDAEDAALAAADLVGNMIGFGHLFGG